MLREIFRATRHLMELDFDLLGMTAAMPPRASVDERMHRLRAIRDQGDLDQIREAAVKHLNDGCNLVVAEAAKLVGHFELSGVEPALLTTWNRLIQHTDPIKADKGCTAKAAILEALGQLAYDDPDFYLAHIKYQQIEPAWPKEEDTAENVRAGCAFGLARSKQLRIVDKLNAFVDYLMGSRADRINAIKAITDTRHESAIPLLRLKLLSEDPEAEVVGLCMSGLLDLAPTSSIAVVASFLTNHDETVVLEAAAALGICGRPEAIKALIACWQRTADQELQRSLLISIGLSRDSSATSFLLTQLEANDDPETVLEALKPACTYQDTQDKVRLILEYIGNRELILRFERKFGRGS